jgi:tRNA 2-thiouridine synthesizing protein B
MPGSALLLIENGVYAAIRCEANSLILGGLPDDVRFFVLGSDLAARGISENELDARFISTDYAGFVDLVEQYPSAQSWL